MSRWVRWQCREAATIVGRQLGDLQGGRRIDARRNRARLLRAAGEVFREDDEVTMPLIAERAELSVATAYRFFPSLDDLRSEYLRTVIEQLAEYSECSRAQGRELFDKVLCEWLRLQSVFGDAIISLRSREGYLSRLNHGEPVISTVRRAWEEPVSQLLNDLNIDDIVIEDALYLHNILFDPRDVKDLRSERGWSDAEIQSRLTNAYCAVLESWTARQAGN